MVTAAIGVLTDPAVDNREARLAASNIIAQGSQMLMYEIDRQEQRPWWRRAPKPGEPWPDA